MLGLKRIAAILETIFRELGTFDNSIFNRYHLFFVDNYIVYYDSIDNYKSRTEPSTQRKLHYHLNILILVSYLIKYILLTLFEDEWLNYYIGEIYFLYFPYYKRIYVYLICLIIFITMLKLAIFYYERNLFVNWGKLLSNESGVRLLKHNQDTLLIMANLIYWTGTIFPLVGLWFLSIDYIFLNFLAYLYPDHNFSLIVSLISIVQTIFVIKIINYMIASCIMFFSILIIFLKFKQDEIVKSIRLNYLWRNKIQLLNNLKVYNDFKISVDQSGKVINKLIGIFYLITPILFSQFITILNGQTNNFFELFLILCVKIMSPFMLFLLCIIIHIATSITTVNLSITKYLYPVFKSNCFNRPNYQVGLYQLYLSKKYEILSDIMIKMKIDSFIARLNEEYVGFYCLNLFEMTKLVILEYFYVFLTAYMFIHDLS